ncbi:MAG: flagellin [Rhizobiales bacterium]|nr:flagellin [Hyphomicrobiales bacterium]OJU36747.1 MAG: flagellin [Rhizobiales bacterium 68-8]
MSSLLTNATAMTALQTLTQVNKNLADTQARISTGLKVSKASDNAAYWSIATTMRSDNAALGAVQEALGLGASKVDTAYAGMEQAIEYVKQIKDKLIAAQEPSADRAKLQEDIAQLQDQLRGIAESATFSGENWLQADLTAGGGSVTKSVVSSFVRDSTGSVSVTTIDYVLDGSTVLFDTGGDTGLLDSTSAIQGASVTLNINVGGVVGPHTVAAFTTDDVIAAGSATFNGSYASAGGDDYVKVGDDTWVKAVDQTTVPTQEVQFDDGTDVWAVDLTSTVASTTSSIDTLTITTATTRAQLDGMLQMVEDRLSDITSAAASLGSISSRIGLQDEFISKLTDSLDRGIGRLVDADMEEESARLSALQVQQQLGIQALSIANSNSQNILTLFRQ